MSTPRSIPRIELVAFDLDDTLYPEIDYVRSGFGEVAGYLAPLAGLSAEDVARQLWRQFESGDRRKVFDVVLAELGLTGQVTVASLVERYRSHRPRIRLRSEAGEVLDALRQAGLHLAVVTDGPPVQQQHKAEALNLASRVDQIVFTGSLPGGCAKPSPVAFEMLMRCFGVPGSACIYVADNPRKDFLGPRQLGWGTIQFVHPDGIYCKETAPAGGQPDRCIADLRDLHEIVLGPARR